MMILVSGATRTLERFPEAGLLVQPRCGNSIDRLANSGRKWAADNDCFQRLDINAYWRMLSRIASADRSNLLWVTVPDVVGDAQATINRWVEWYPQLESLGLPAAFVGQDGLGLIWDQIPWHELAAVFIGGTDEWKLTEESERLMREAKRRGKLIHVGRVNSRCRIRDVLMMSRHLADSIDGTSTSKWPDANLPKMLRWMKREACQPALF